MQHYSIDNYTHAKLAGFNPDNIVGIERIGNKQAWVLTDNEGNKWLQSYNTIVSVKKGWEFTHFGKWSSTTSRHQSYFASHF